LPVTGKSAFLDYVSNTLPAMESNERVHDEDILAEEPTETAPGKPGSSRHSLYTKVSIVFVGLLGINAFVAWILQFYFGESILINMSYTASDPSWVPSDTHFPAAIGQHFFGDYEQYLGYARSAFSPFTSPDVHTSAYGPFAVVLVKMFDFLFGWPNEVFVFLILSVVILFFVNFQIMGRGIDAVLVSLLLLMSGPMIVTLDRGNFQILMAGLFALICVGVLKDQWKLVVLSVSFAIAIKAYAAVFLLVLIRQRRWRELAATCFITIALFEVSFLLVPGGVISNFKSFLHTNLFFAGSATSDLANFVSVPGLVYKYFLVIVGPASADSFIGHIPNWALQTPGLIVVAMSVAILWRSKRAEVGLIAILAMVQLAPLASGSYLELNLIIELGLLLRLLVPRDSDIGGTSAKFDLQGVHRQVSSQATRLYRGLLVASVFLLTVGLVPWVFRFGTIQTLNTSAGPTTSATGAVNIIGPTANLACLALLFIATILPSSGLPGPSAASDHEIDGATGVA